MLYSGMKNLDDLDGIHIYVGIIGILGVAGLATLSILFIPGCEVDPASPGSTTGTVETDPELTGTIVCYEPWDEIRRGHPSARGVEIYRDSIGPWTSGPGTRVQARTGRGYVFRDDNNLRYRDGNGNWVYLMNYPCRITMPMSE